VDCSVGWKLPGGTKPGVLSHRYLEREADPVPAGDGMQAGRIEEAVRLSGCALDAALAAEQYRSRRPARRPGAEIWGGPRCEPETKETP